MDTNDIDIIPGLDLGDIGLADLDFDLSAFDLSGIDGAEEAKINTRYVKPPLYLGERRSAVLYDRVHDVSDAILAGERVDAVLSGNFIFGDFFEAFAVETNSFIDDLTLSTLSLSQENVDSLHNLLAGDYLGSLNLIVSDYWYAHNRPNVSYVYEQLDLEDRFQLAVAGVHTKIAMLRFGERKILIHGSANLRSSRSVEVVTIETNPALYDFHRAWHETILQRYATVRKGIRASALFDLISQGESDGQR
ncbi:MAG TPA: hypothetical protein VFI96_05165 [Longimicrobiaceae bacterium]|nr:hypothetical protein [Longimicrobiaceae bacterium]